MSEDKEKYTIADNGENLVGKEADEYEFRWSVVDQDIDIQSAMDREFMKQQNELYRYKRFKDLRRILPDLKTLVEYLEQGKSDCDYAQCFDHDIEVRGETLKIAECTFQYTDMLVEVIMRRCSSYIDSKNEEHIKLKEYYENK